MLQAENLGARVGERWLWRGINLNVSSGSRLGVSGPSGSGKSQLLRCLAALATPEEGAIHFRGEPLNGLFLPAYRAQVMYLPAEPLVIDGTVESNLQAPYALASHARHSYDSGRITAWLELLEREQSFLARSTRNLSSGERQIMALLRALQLDANILLMDEATASLDPASEQRAEKLLLDWINERPGRAMVLVSHSVEQMQRLCDQQLGIGKP